MARYDLDISTADGIRQVHALVLSKYGRVLARNEWDVDDFVQDVLLRLLAKPYDPERASVSTWVLLHTRQLLHERILAERRTVPIGETYSYEDGDREPCDPADVAVAEPDTSIREEHVAAYIVLAQRRFQPSSATLVESVVRGRIAGLSLADIAVHCGKTRERVRQVVEKLPRHVPIGTTCPFDSESNSTPEPESDSDPTQTELPESDPNPTSTELPEPSTTTKTRPPRRKGWQAANDYWRTLRRTTPEHDPVRPGWLTQAQVALIRESYVPGTYGYRRIGRDMGICWRQVALVIRGERHGETR